MCLAVTGKVISIDNGQGEVMVGNRQRRVSFVALPDAVPGDYVLVSLGMALERISEEEAQQVDAAWDEISLIDPNAREVTQ